MPISGWGEYLLQLLMPSNDREIRGFCYNADKRLPSGVGVSGVMFPSSGDAEAHALYYGHVLESCRMLLSPKASATLKKTSPSAEAWTRTMCSQFAHCENADAGVVTKLLTPCTGPVSPAPQEAWQQADPMWNITDAGLGCSGPSKQGRLWWRPEVQTLQMHGVLSAPLLRPLSNTGKSDSGSDWQDAASTARSEIWQEADEVWLEEGADIEGDASFFGRNALVSGFNSALATTTTAWQLTTTAVRGRVRTGWRDTLAGSMRAVWVIADARAWMMRAIGAWGGLCSQGTLIRNALPVSPSSDLLSNKALTPTASASTLHTGAQPLLAPQVTWTPEVDFSSDVPADTNQPTAPRSLTKEERETLQAFRSESLRALQGSDGSDDTEVEETCRAALKAVEALVKGLCGSVGASIHLESEPDALSTRWDSEPRYPELVVTLRVPAVARIATRSRLPLELTASGNTVRFRMSRVGPSGCPCACRCHKRLFGYAGGKNGELKLSTDREDMEPLSCSTLLPPPSHDLSAFEGCGVVLSLTNEFGVDPFERQEVQGKLILIRHDHSTDPSQDEKLLNARTAGAVGVIFYDPSLEYELGCSLSSCLPAVHVSARDGEELATALRAGKRVESLGLTEFIPEVRLECGQALPAAATWLHVSGLHVLRPSSSRDAWAALQAAVPPDEQTPERAFAWFLANRTRLFPLETALFNRVIECVHSRFIVRRAISQSQWGHYLLQMLAPSNDRIIHALRFEPCSQCPSGIGVSAILFPAGGDAEAHALNYGFVLQGCQLLQSFNEASMLKRTSPSVEAWARLTSSQYANSMPADAAVVTKLLTPCTGPVGGTPSLSWQRSDPMWNIVDRKQSLLQPAVVQGRLWWRPDRSRFQSQASFSSLADAADRDRDGSSYCDVQSQASDGELEDGVA